MSGYGAEHSGQILDLSQSGVAVRLEGRVAWPIGGAVRVWLEVPDLPVLEVAGWIARCREGAAGANGHTSLAIAFEGLAAEAREALSAWALSDGARRSRSA